MPPAFNMLRRTNGVRRSRARAPKYSAGDRRQPV